MNVMDICQRIESIIQAHRPKRLCGSPEVEECQQGCIYEAGSWYRHLAMMIKDDLGLTPEDHFGPITVPEYDKDGHPIMNCHLFPPQQKWKFHWVTRQRYVTDWLIISEPETSEELSDRLQREHNE